MKKIILTVLAAVIVPGSADANCGSATCPLNNYRYMQAGMLDIGLRYEYIDQDRIFVGSSRSHVGALPNPHDEIQTINALSVIHAEYGISNAFGVDVEVPMVHREHRHQAEGTIESFNFTGLGDIIVSGQYTMLNPTEEYAPFLNFRAGVKLRTGVTDAASLAGEQAEVTIQPGTGSVDAIFGLNYRQTVTSVPTATGEFSALPLILSISYRMAGKGTEGYRFGDVTMAHIGTEYQFAGKMAFLLQLNGLFREHSDVGSTGEFRGNTGGSVVFLSPGLRIQLSDAFSAYSYVQIPVYQHVNGIQQTSPFNLEFGLSANIKLIE